MKVLKIKKTDLETILDGYYVPNTSCYFIGSFYEKIGQDKVCFSIKCGKKRKMICGKIKILSYESSMTSSGMLYCIFIPNNIERVKLLLNQITN